MKIRASDGQFQASYAVTNPGSLAFDGQRIWVTQRTSTGGNTVRVLFAADGKQALDPITVGTMPNDADLGRLGDVGGRPRQHI